MSALDASFLHLETASAPMHLGWVGVFEGSAPAVEEIDARVEANLALVPRYRRKLRFVPLGMSQPRWVDDPHFNLAYHLRHTRLPAPGGERQLRELVGRVMSPRLDRARPLWELWIVEGLPERRWAVLSKVHDCMVDGVSAVDLTRLILDRSPAGAPAGGTTGWRPAPEPRAAELLAGAVVERLTSPIELMRGVGRAARAPRQLGTRTSATARGLVTMRGLVRRTPPLSINGPLGPSRRWAWAGEAVRRQGGARRARRDGQRRRAGAGHERLPGAAARARRAGPGPRPAHPHTSIGANTGPARRLRQPRVGDVLPQPVGIAEPVQRVDSIRTQMQALKDSGEAVAGETLTSPAGFAPPVLLALAERDAKRVPQRNVNTVATNVPGPQYPLYALSRRMLEAFPYVPLGGQVRVGVAVFSYDGGLGFGVTGDWDTAPDLDVLCAGIEHGTDELLEAAVATPHAADAATGAPPANAS